MLYKFTLKLSPNPIASFESEIDLVCICILHGICMVYGWSKWHYVYGAAAQTIQMKYSTIHHRCVG